MDNFIKMLYLIAFMVFGSNAAFAVQSSSIPSVKLIMTKFGMAMMGVVLFSILLYAGLSLYNKLFVDAQVKNFNLRKDSLRTPIDRDEAIMNFITRCRLK